MSRKIDKVHREIVKGLTKRVLNELIENIENSVGNLEGCVESTEQYVDNAIEILERYKNAPQFKDMYNELNNIANEIEGIEEISEKLDKINDKLKEMLMKVESGESGGNP
jgi:molecular chaperone GrpE (heat shock protein)